MIVIKDFFATWCPPCRMQTPIMHELEKEYKENKEIKFEIVDVDKDTKQAEKYGVTSIPTIIIEKEGEIVQKFVGLQSKETIKTVIEENK